MNAMRENNLRQRLRCIVSLSPGSSSKYGPPHHLHLVTISIFPQAINNATMQVLHAQVVFAKAALCGHRRRRRNTGIDHLVHAAGQGGDDERIRTRRRRVGEHDDVANVWLRYDSIGSLRERIVGNCRELQNCHGSYRTTNYARRKTNDASKHGILIPGALVQKADW